MTKEIFWKTSRDNLLNFLDILTGNASFRQLITHIQSQKFWDDSTKHNLLGFPLKKIKDSPIKTLPLLYVNVAGQ